MLLLILMGIAKSIIHEPDDAERRRNKNPGDKFLSSMLTFIFLDDDVFGNRKRASYRAETKVSSSPSLSDLLLRF